MTTTAQTTQDAQTAPPTPIKATQHGVSFMDDADGGYRNTYILLHETAPSESEAFGAMCVYKVVKRGKPDRSGRLYRLDADPETEYGTYAEFAAAYYRQFPERMNP